MSDVILLASFSIASKSVLLLSSNIDSAIFDFIVVTGEIFKFECE